VSRRLLFALIAGALALTLGVATALAADPGANTANGVETQTEAGPHVFTPSSTPCVDTLINHAQFNSYDNPATSVYNPGTCPGPWSKVVLTVTASVSGDQFDRLLDVEIGNAVFLHGSTSEPDGMVFNTDSAVAWTISRDVTQYSALLTRSQPVSTELDNVVTSTYTGIYDVTVTLSFYPVTTADPAPSEPNVILPISGSLKEPMLNLDNCSAADEDQGAEITFPRNLDRLTAELFASGGGTKEEFWWLDPEEDGTSSPYREVDIYVDGQLAGAAPVYPSTFTGFNGPDFWEPIPSPRAWDLVPYTVDLTPFIGELSDGQPHHITLGVANAAYADDSPCGTDYWKVAANLEGYTDPTAQVTGGTVSPETNATAPTEDVTEDPTGQLLYYDDDVSHNLSFAGSVDTGQGVDTVTVNDDITEAVSETPATENADWTWDSASTTTTPAGTVSVASDDHTYGATNSSAAGDYEFTDDDAQADTRGTTTTFTSTTAETMRTQDALGEGGALVAGTQADVDDECWQYSDSTGLAYEQQITAAAGQVLSDSTSRGCSSLPALGSLTNPFATATTTGTTTTATTTTGTTTAGTTTGTPGTTTTGTGTATPSPTTSSPGTTSSPTSTDSPAPASPGAASTTPLGLGPVGLGGAAATARPVATLCTLPRRLVFAQHPAAPVREIRAVLYVDGRRIRTVSGRRITAVSLTRPGAAKFTLTVVATLSDGEVVSHRLSYSGCTHGATRTRVLHPAQLR
jgi:hypothetical protein